MKIVFAILLLGSVKFLECRPQADSTIISYKYEPLRDVSNNEQRYKYSYKTSNNIEAEQTGIVDSNGVLTVRGCFSYMKDADKLYKVCYIANQNGYRILPSSPQPKESVGPVEEYLKSIVMQSLQGGGLG